MLGISWNIKFIGNGQVGAGDMFGKHGNSSNIKLTDFCWLNPREVSVHCQRRFGEDLQRQTMHQRVHVPSPPEVSLIAGEPTVVWSNVERAPDSAFKGSAGTLTVGSVF